VSNIMGWREYIISRIFSKTYKKNG